MSRIEPVTVVLADAHEPYRAGLARAIAEHDDLELVGVSGDGRDAIAIILRERPSVAVLDVRLAGLNGFAVSERIAACRPPLETRLVLLTALPNAGQYARARRAGAWDCIEKGASRESICAALVDAARAGAPQR